MTSYLTKNWDIYLFKDQQQNTEFINNGFFIVPFLDNNEIEEIQNKISEINIPDVAFFHSHGHLSYRLKKEMDLLIKEFLSIKISKLLKKEYSVFTGVYIHKNPSPKSDMFLHADDSLCDENIFMPFNIWIPLVDVNYQNGTMCIIPGSHQKTNVYRGRTTHDSYIKNNKRIFYEDYLPVTIQKGYALFYHPGCVHFSPPNTSISPRPVIAAACIPKDAKPCLFFEKKIFPAKRLVYKYYIDFELFYNWNNKDEPKKAATEIITLKER